MNKRPVSFYMTFFFALSFSGHAQIVEQIKLDISVIQTTAQATEYLKRNAAVIGEVYSISSRVDTTEMDKELYLSGQGNLIDFASEDQKTHYFFKTLEKGELQSFKVQYIYLDNKKLTLDEIDSLRGVIMKRLAHGEAFDKLAMQYSMDGNAKRGGDLGWFDEGMMMPEFEEKIKSRNTGDVFTIDIPSEKWYYVVRKSHDPMMYKKVTVLYIVIKKGG